MTELKRILLVEDNPNDVGLTRSALAENHLANDFVIALRELGLFWAVINQPPPGTVGKP
jgi:hypothetical protein